MNFGFRSLEFGDEKYYWFNNLEYKEFRLNWIKGVFIDEKDRECRHIFITNFEIKANRVSELVAAGRERWKIENEGFNTQKNTGLNLSHQYSRRSMRAVKNYYQCMQIAHMILNLYEKWGRMKELKEAKTTIRHLVSKLLGEMREWLLDVGRLDKFLMKRIKIGFST